MFTLTDKEKALLDELKKTNLETYSHSLRVKKYTAKMLACINQSKAESYSRADINNICKGALLHDIGKLFIKNVVLTKATALSVMESDYMKQHTRLGYDAIKDELSDSEREIIKNVLLLHHERVDGSGYEHVKDLPLYIQAVSICDVFDAIHSDRSYHDGLPTPGCFKLIRAGKCGFFNDDVIEYLAQITQNID